MKNILPIENILLNLPVMQKEEAIYTAAEVLRKGGYVTDAYYEAMLLKEKECETYIANGVAIPHGISHSEQEILHSGIAVLQFRIPIDYHGNAVHLVIGIAGKQQEHITMLSQIACVLQDRENVQKIVECRSRHALAALLQPASVQEDSI